MAELKNRKSIAAFTAIFLLLSAAFSVAGFSSASASSDTTRPWDRITSPAAFSIVPTSSGDIIVAGLAGDKGGSGVKVVELKVNGSRYVSANPVAQGDWSSWSLTINIPMSGVYRITPRVTDNAGNQAWNSIYIKVIRDSSPPAVSISTPQAGATLPVAGLAVQGAAQDGQTGVKLVRAKIDGGSYVDATPKAPNDWSSWTVSFNFLAEGQHTLYASASDRAGNTGESSIGVYAKPISIQADTMAPTVEVTSPADGSQVTADSGWITIKGTASDNVKVSLVEVRIDEGGYKAASPKAPGDWSSWTVTMPVSDGERRIVPRATDNSGNQAWNSIYVTAGSSDTTAPTPQPSSGDLDPFGIAKLYPTASGSDNEYYTKTDATTVTEFRDGGRVDRLPSGFSKNPDGSWNIPSGTTPRWVINGGWRNIEMTMQVKINSGTLVQLYANGEEHTNTVTGAWHGSANKMRVYAAGSMGFIKELYHETGNSGYTNEIATKSFGTTITGKWVTVKYVGYNVNNNTQRKLEAYVSLNNDNKFVKVAEYLDNGNWLASTRFDNFMSYMKSNYPDAVPKNRDTGQVMHRNEVVTWMGDLVSFRSDGADYDFKNVSVREISAAGGPDLQYLK